MDKQVWRGNNTESIGEEIIDATHEVLALTARKVRAIKDCHETSDQIGQNLVDHDGPFAVYLEAAILQFFGVNTETQITGALVRKARQLFQRQPEQEYRMQVAITMTGEYTLRAKHPSLLKSLMQTKVQEMQRPLNAAIKIESISPA